MRFYYTGPFATMKNRNVWCKIAEQRTRATKPNCHYLLVHFSSMHRRFHGSVVFFSLALVVWLASISHVSSFVRNLLWVLNGYGFIIPFDDSWQNNTVHYIPVCRSKPKTEKKMRKKNFIQFVSFPSSTFHPITALVLYLPIIYLANHHITFHSNYFGPNWFEKGFSTLNIMDSKENPSTKPNLSTEK